MSECEVYGVTYITQPFDEMPMGFVGMYWGEAYGTLAEGIQRYYTHFAEWPADIFELERSKLGKGQLLPETVLVWFMGNLAHEPWVMFESVDDLVNAMAGSDVLYGDGSEPMELGEIPFEATASQPHLFDGIVEVHTYVPEVG